MEFGVLVFPWENGDVVGQRWDGPRGMKALLLDDTSGSSCPADDCSFDSAMVAGELEDSCAFGANFSGGSLVEVRS